MVLVYYGTNSHLHFDIMMWMVVITVCVALFIASILYILTIRWTNKSHQKIIAFFHPHCAGGGGGERVLWCIIRNIQMQWPSYRIVVYCNEAKSIAENVKV